MRSATLCIRLPAWCAPAAPRRFGWFLLLPVPVAEREAQHADAMAAVKAEIEAVFARCFGRAP